MKRKPRPKTCDYDENDKCRLCGNIKGWRVHKMHRGSTYTPCPGRKWQ